MPIRGLCAPLSIAGDPPGPYEGGRALKILVDLPPKSRQVEHLRGLECLALPVPEHMLWSLCQHERIELVWIPSEGEDGPGALRYSTPSGDDDEYLPVVVTTFTGHSSSAIWPYHRMRE